MKWGFLVVLALLAGAMGFFYFKGNLTLSETPRPTPTPNPAATPEQKEKKAAFLIFTNGTRREFTDSKYHNRSEQVFIESENPSVIQVKAAGVTYGDFFSSLPAPMKLEDTCLYTGTGQKFCNFEDSTLKFYINGEKVGSIQTRPINHGDKLLITFGKESEEEIARQLTKVSDPLSTP